MQMYKITGEAKYRDHGMAMYRWSRNECGGGLFNVKDGLWWRDADYVPPYKEPDGKDCYWSRGNGWVYAALVRCMNELSPKEKAYKELKKDFLLMSEGLRSVSAKTGCGTPASCRRTTPCLRPLAPPCSSMAWPGAYRRDS